MEGKVKITVFYLIIWINCQKIHKKLIHSTNSMFKIPFSKPTRLIMLPGNDGTKPENATQVIMDIKSPHYSTINFNFPLDC